MLSCFIHKTGKQKQKVPLKRNQYFLPLEKGWVPVKIGQWNQFSKIMCQYGPQYAYTSRKPHLNFKPSVSLNYLHAVSIF